LSDLAQLLSEKYMVVLNKEKVLKIFNKEIDSFKLISSNY